jgi:hypothetical protein
MNTHDINTLPINYSNIFDFCIGTSDVSTCHFYINSKILYNTYNFPKQFKGVTYEFIIGDKL